MGVGAWAAQQAEAIEVDELEGLTERETASAELLLLLNSGCGASSQAHQNMRLLGLAHICRTKVSLRQPRYIWTGGNLKSQLACYVVPSAYACQVRGLIPGTFEDLATSLLLRS